MSADLLARTMTADQAAWVRDHAWTNRMRKTYYGDPGKNNGTPGLYTHCDCQAGLTHWCQTNAHRKCHRATPLTGPATWIVSRAGYVMEFAEPYAHHSTLDSIEVGPAHNAAVWLADRICRWVCPCDCHSAPAAPLQLDLFGLAS